MRSGNDHFAEAGPYRTEGRTTNFLDAVPTPMTWIPPQARS
jgi:hypothetical protein